MNLLLIDGDESFLKFLSTGLRKKNLCIRQANNAVSAIKILSEHKIDLILSGSEIPGSQLLLFICSLRGRFPDTPLILFSGRESGLNGNTALLLGANELVSKDLNFNQLYSAISKYAA